MPSILLPSSAVEITLESNFTITQCLAALDAFGLPAGLNLYLTAAGTPVSAPPHSDKQDVFVVQTAGKKRWRVYAPPPPARKPAVSACICFYDQGVEACR